MKNSKSNVFNFALGVLGGGFVWWLYLYMFVHVILPDEVKSQIVALIVVGIIGNVVRLYSIKGAMYGIYLVQSIFTIKNPVRYESVGLLGDTYYVPDRSLLRWYMIVMLLMTVGVFLVKRVVKEHANSKITESSTKRKEMKSMKNTGSTGNAKASSQPLIDGQEYSTSRYPQQQYTEKTTQEFNQNVREPITKMERDTVISVEGELGSAESVHGLQDVNQHDVGVDALNQFVQGLK